MHDRIHTKIYIQLNYSILSRKMKVQDKIWIIEIVLTTFHHLIFRDEIEKIDLVNFFTKKILKSNPLFSGKIVKKIINTYDTYIHYQKDWQSKISNLFKCHHVFH